MSRRYTAGPVTAAAHAYVTIVAHFSVIVAPSLVVITICRFVAAGIAQLVFGTDFHVSVILLKREIEIEKISV